MAFVGKMLELISPDKGLEPMRPWWDIVSGITADAMTVISLVSISLQLFGGFGSAVKCTPVLPCPADRVDCLNSGHEMEEVKEVGWVVRQVIDSWCVEKDMRFYAKYLGYILFLQVWILLAIDNFWLKWSKSASKLRTFISLTESCSKSKCDHDMVKMQLKRATGERIESSGYKQGQLVKVSEKEIQDALNLSDKSMKMIDTELNSKILANIYTAKTVVKLIASLIFFGLALYRLQMGDFRFKFNCDVSRLNQHQDISHVPHNDSEPQRNYHIVEHERFECANVVGPFSRYVMITFLVLTLVYIVVSLVALCMFAYIANPLKEILQTYEKTDFKEDLETKFETLMKKDRRRDGVFLLFFLYTTNKEAFQAFKEFLSPLFHDDLIRLATNRRWDEAEMERRKIPLGGADDGFSISLADVDLTSLPACLFSVSKLKELDVSFNEKINLDGVEKLVDLTDLKVESCKLTDLSFCLRLPKLKRLEAADNQIVGIPEGFEKLSNLAFLDLTNNENLATLPPVLNTMLGLSEICVDPLLMESLDPNQKIWAQSRELETVFKRRESRFAQFFSF